MIMMQTVWTAVYGGLNYEVNNYGSVRRVASPMSAAPERLLRPHTNRGGYQCFVLYRDGHRIPTMAHVLVLEAFVGPRQSGMVARHLNGNPADNRLWNFVWGTHLENAQDCIAHGTRPRGSGHKCAKLTEADIPIIRAMRASGSTQPVVAARFGVSVATISHIDTGRKWTHA